MKISGDVKLDFEDVLLAPARSTTSSRKDVELYRPFKFYHSKKEWHGIPFMAANMPHTGNVKMAQELLKHSMVTCLHKYHTHEQLESFYSYFDIAPFAWVSIGMCHDDLLKLEKLSDINCLGYTPNICIDIANGYTDRFVSFCKSVRTKFGKEPIIMAGNVCTPEMVQELIIHGGVDIVKVGIGPGSVCSTRLKTGVGYPQFSAIVECSHAAHGLKSGDGRMGLICADGGCRTPSDVAKSYAAGADFVMVGGMLAGTEECEGEWEYGETELEGKYKKSLKFYGMSSEEAQDKHSGGMNDYAASEGKVRKVPYKGKAEEVLSDIKGSVRSACSYIGAKYLADMSKCANFIKVNRTHYDTNL